MRSVALFLLVGGVSLLTGASADAGLILHRHQSRTVSRAVVRTHAPAPRRVAFLGVPLRAAPAGKCPGGVCPAK